MEKSQSSQLGEAWLGAQGPLGSFAGLWRAEGAPRGGEEAVTQVLLERRVTRPHGQAWACLLFSHGSQELWGQKPWGILHPRESSIKGLIFLSFQCCTEGTFGTRQFFIGQDSPTQGRRFSILGLKALLAGSSSPVVETTPKYPLQSQRPWGWYQPWYLVVEDHH